ncbi:MAG: leucine-rich repeat domain-containing protein [Treponema sp.]|jgi:hypothetical protein|nr:leucine-rich repeat domain-containing protein [Treponema sp.]
MKVKFRFAKLLVWGSIALLGLAIMGCPILAGSVSDQLSQGKTEEPSGQKPEVEKPENEGNENGETGEREPGEEGGETGEREPGEEGGETGEREPGEEDSKIMKEGHGLLVWKIKYPVEKTWEAVLTVFIRIDDKTFIPWKYFDLTVPGAAERTASLPAGTYKIEYRFMSHGKNVGSTETVHISPGLKTTSNYTGIDANALPDAAEFSSVDELEAYLNGRPENTAADPYPVKLTGVDISSKAAKGDTMRTLYEALEKSERFVSLDLRGGIGTELIPASTAPVLAGRKKIVSIILPETVTVVASNGFSGYDELRSVVLPKVVTINQVAFKNLGNIETVSAPVLITIVDDTSTGSSRGNFYGCIRLTSIYFPKLETIGHHAFYGCDALTEVLLPKVAEVGNSIFAECTALKTVVLPVADLIGNRAFYNDKALENLVLGTVPPNVEGSANFSTGYPEKIYAPVSAVDAYKRSEFWSKMKDSIYPIGA